MRMLQPLLIMMAIFSAGCSTTPPQKNPTRVASNIINRQHVATTTKEIYPAKNPQKVAMYNEKKEPHTAYRIIGAASVDKYNLFGVERDEETLHNMMKKLAASIGGDGIIDINNNDHQMQGRVIAFQKILI